MLHSTKSRVLKSENDESTGGKVLQFDPALRQRRPAADTSESSKKARLVSKLHSSSKSPKDAPSGKSSKKNKQKGEKGSSFSSWGRSSQYQGGTRSNGSSLAKPFLRGPHHKHAARKAHGSHPVSLWAARAVLFAAMAFVVALVFRGCLPGL